MRAVAATLVTRALATEWTPETPDRLEREIVRAGVAGAETLDLYVLAAHDPRHHEVAPRRALQVQLGTLQVLGPVTDASLWVLLANGRPSCVQQVGELATARRARRAASDVLHGLPSRATGPRVRVRAVPVNVAGRLGAAFVFRCLPWSQEAAVAFAEEAARAMSPTLGRLALLDRLEAQQALLDAADRRIARVGFDLHDGALQRISGLMADLAHERRQLDLYGERLREREELARSVDEQLRGLISALPSTAARRELGAELRRQVRTFTRSSGIAARCTIDGSPWSTTESQRIALVRVVQEALANVREHSDATLVQVSLEFAASAMTLLVADNGRGFEAGGESDAGQKGRLGLLTMSERIQLLGGVFEIDTRPGGPTVVRAVVPRFEPFPARGAGSNGRIVGNGVS